MSVLMKCELLDAAKAAQSFSSREDFWVTLTDVATNGRRYLRDYTPSVILVDAAIQKRFLKELDETGKLLYSLKIKRAPEMLEGLRGAVERNDEKSLSDGLRVFYAEMDILLGKISEALLPDKKTKVRPNDLPIVMAVDDVPEVLAGITEMLIDHYRVIALTNGFSALQALETHIPAVFILDIEMPEMNGYTLAKRIRSMERFQKTPILFLTGKDTREHVLAAMLHGGNEYLLKPISQNDLLDKIGQYVQN